MPAFCHYYPALTPEAFYALDDDDREALRAHMVKAMTPQGA